MARPASELPYINPSYFHLLSKQQRQIYNLVKNGESLKDIALALNISEASVRSQLRHIRNKAKRFVQEIPPRVNYAHLKYDKKCGKDELAATLQDKGFISMVFNSHANNTELNREDKLLLGINGVSYKKTILTARAKKFKAIAETMRGEKSGKTLLKIFNKESKFINHIIKHLKIKTVESNVDGERSLILNRMEKEYILKEAEALKQNSSLGERIYLFRELQGLTQKELAEALNVDESYISKIENGNRTPSKQLLLSILKILNVSHGYFPELPKELITRRSTSA